MATQSKTPALDVKEELAKLKINNPVKGTVVENAGIREKLGIANHEQLTVVTDGVIGDFQSESIVDNATGIDVTGSVTCDGFTSTGIDDNATSTAITIDASENVGIGTTAPAAKLHIGGSSATDFDALTLRNSSGTDGSAAVLGFEASTGAEGVDAVLAAQIKGIREGSGTTGALAFLTTSGGVPAERMRIESAGNVGIGTSSPAAKLDVNGTLACDGFTSTGIDDNATSTAITIANTNVEMRGNANVRVTLGTAGTSGANNSSNWVYGNGTNLRFNTGGGYYSWEVGGNEKMRITSTGDVEVETGNLVIGTSGKGIDFSATSDGSGTMTSEVLDDYETGTWTPTLSSSGTLPTVTSYSDRVGTYTKIGNTIRVTCFIRAIMSSAGTGSPRVTGLPYNTSGDLQPAYFGLRDIVNGYPSAYVTGALVHMDGVGFSNIGGNNYLCFTAVYQTS